MTQEEELILLKSRIESLELKFALFKELHFSKPVFIPQPEFPKQPTTGEPPINLY